MNVLGGREGGNGGRWEGGWEWREVGGEGGRREGRGGEGQGAKHMATTCPRKAILSVGQVLVHAYLSKGQVTNVTSLAL